MKNPAMYRGIRRPQSSPVVLQRRLTLDDFPMEHGVKDAQQRAVSSRQERLRLQDRLQSARQESETLREYSRRRFQTVVDVENKPRPQPTPLPQRTPRIPPPLSRPMTTDGSHRPYPYPLTPTTPTNGPTQLGSILYNGEHLQLSSMRTRPQSEPPGRFDHLRGTYVNYPYIQRVLEQSNCDYRLVSTPCHSAREEGYREKDSFDPTDFVMLVPVTRVDVRDHVKARQKSEAWAEEDGPLLASTARSRSPMSGGSQENVEELTGGERGELAEGERSQGPGERGSTPYVVPPLDLTQAMSPNASLTHSADQSTPQESQENQPPQEHGNPSLVSLPPEEIIVITPVSTKVTRKLPSRPTSAASLASSSMSSITYTPRPHCWVDDVTISSDESLTERDASIQQDGDEKASLYSEDPANKGLLLGQVARTMSPSGDKKKVSTIQKSANSPGLKRVPSASKTKPQQGGCPRSLKQSTASGSKAGGKPAIAEELTVLIEKMEEEEVLVLPRFVCPSSETKSRQTAIKEWLAKSSFGGACRTLPLM